MGQELLLTLVLWALDFPGVVRFSHSHNLKLLRRMYMPYMKSNSY